MTLTLWYGLNNFHLKYQKALKMETCFQHQLNIITKILVTSFQKILKILSSLMYRILEVVIRKHLLISCKMQIIVQLILLKSMILDLKSKISWNTFSVMNGSTLSREVPNKNSKMNLLWL